MVKVYIQQDRYESVRGRLCIALHVKGPPSVILQVILAQCFVGGNRIQRLG